MRRSAAALLAVLLLALPAGPAAAADRTAWWSEAGGGGLVAPQPTTAEDDLRVSRLPAGSAFAGVLYEAPGATTATLVLTVREDRTVGTPDVVACPTVGTEWEAGGNQPADSAPEVACDAGMAFGLLSEDGTTLTFGLDATQQAAPGTWSLALLPQPDGSLPFSVDLAAPDRSAFAADDVERSQTGGTGAVAPPADAPAPPPPADSTGLSAAILPPPSAVPTDPLTAAPLLPAPESGAAAVEEPLLAAGPVVQAAPSVPVAAPTEPSEAARLVAVAALVGVAAYLGRMSAQAPHAPQLLGGRARAVSPVVAAADPGPASRTDRPRGIGRFARPRDAAPRRLR